MRVILVLALVLAPTALAGSIPAPIVLPKPGFPAPAGDRLHVRTYDRLVVAQIVR
ncbi:MAG TPA: hypothetical protein VEW90_01080 [Gaiellaceae bacterium]|nr:hypothetical protein [Gaiellaceae bacterium]